MQQECKQFRQMMAIRDPHLNQPPKQSSLTPKPNVDYWLQKRQTTRKDWQDATALKVDLP